MLSSSLRTAEVWQVRREGTFCQKGNSLPLQEIVAAFEYYESQKHFGKVCLELTAVGEAAVAIECETEMRSQRSDGRVLLRIGIGIGCGNDDDPEPAAVLATRRQHRRTQRIALPVAQREEKRHLSLYMGLEADVGLDRVGPLRTPLAVGVYSHRLNARARLHVYPFHPRRPGCDSEYPKASDFT